MNAESNVSPSELFSEQIWRISNLYEIIDKNGRRVRFVPNTAQIVLYHALWYRNIVLKARQHGVTTLMAIYAMDCCVFNRDFKAGIIAHTLPDASAIFKTKVKTPYDSLPEGIRNTVSALSCTKHSIDFSNGSGIDVSTSYRSGTLQFLHVSELGKIAAKHPHKAVEIRTGAFEAVPKSGIIVVESTAEGNHGDFKEMVDTAQAMQDTGRKLTQLDYKLHFIPWFKESKYKLSPEETKATPIPQRMRDYFKKLADEYAINLTPRQKAWYTVKESMLGQMIWREYPSTHDEPFKVSLDGAYWARQMRKARVDGRITRVPVQTHIPVNTWWDIGRDTTAIWFTQDVGMLVHVVGYLQDSGEGLEFYNNKLIQWAIDKEIRYGTHHFPHDMRVTEWAANKPRIEQAAEMGLYGEILPRMNDKQDGIEAGRTFLQYCIFDEESCEEGIAGLEAYRKEWDQIRGVWKSTPTHDFASHPADSFQYLALNHVFAIEAEMRNARARPVTAGRRF